MLCRLLPREAATPPLFLLQLLDSGAGTSLKQLSVLLTRPLLPIHRSAAHVRASLCPQALGEALPDARLHEVLSELCIHGCLDSLPRRRGADEFEVLEIALEQDERPLWGHTVVRLPRVGLDVKHTGHDPGLLLAAANHEEHGCHAPHLVPQEGLPLHIDGEDIQPPPPPPPPRHPPVQ